MIEIKDMNVTKNGRAILKSITLTIASGEKILVRGESGSGKSTLIKSILFFERFSGIVLFDKQEVGEGNLQDFRSHIGYVGQVVPNLDEPVRDFFKIPYRYRANRLRELNHTKLIQMMSRMNFDRSVMDKNFRDLSGGEKQRLLILQIMMLDKPLYLFDEVTASLDENNTERAIKLITKEKRRTILTISHDPRWTGHVTRIIEMQQGRIKADRRIS